VRRRVGSILGLCFLSSFRTTASLHGQDLDTTDVRVTLDSAIGIARKAAAGAFPDLSNYLLYSVTPRVFKGDPRGLHWQVRWQERAFPHHRWLVVRVYMSNGYTAAERSPPDGASSPTPGPASGGGGDQVPIELNEGER
jgi:hypothetical protein